MIHLFPFWIINFDPFTSTASIQLHVCVCKQVMSSNPGGGYSRYKGVNPDRKSGVEPQRQLVGIFVTFWQFSHPFWSSAILTLSCHWIGPTKTKEWGWFCANLLHFKQSQAQLINQTLSHPITSSPVATGKRWSNRCEYTGSHSCRPAHRCDSGYMVALYWWEQK